MSIEQCEQHEMEEMVNSRIYGSTLSKSSITDSIVDKSTGTQSEISNQSHVERSNINHSKLNSYKIVGSDVNTIDRSNLSKFSSEHSQITDNSLIRDSEVSNEVLSDARLMDRDIY